MFVGALVYVPTVSAAAVAGDDIKCEQFSSVYYLGEDGKRHAYPNEKIYFTHNEGFDHVKVISCDSLGSISLGQNVLYHGGKRLIKAPSVPVVYAVDSSGILHSVKDEQQASQIYGDDWGNRVDDISEAFLSQYTIGDDHPDGQLLDGTVLIDDDGSLFRADENGVAVEVDDILADWQKDNFEKYALPLSGVESRLGNVQKVTTNLRTSIQTTAQNGKLSKITVEDGSEVDVYIEEATEEEKVSDLSKKIQEQTQTQTKEKVGTSKKDDENVNRDVDDESDDDVVGSDTTGNGSSEGSGGTDDDSDTGGDVGSGTGEVPQKSVATVPDPEVSVLVEFTHDSGSTNVYPGETAVLGTYSFTASDGDAWLDYMYVTVVAEDNIVSWYPSWLVGTDAAAVAQDHLSSCVLKDVSTGNVFAGPIGMYGPTPSQLFFYDTFMLTEDVVLDLDLECTFSSLEPTTPSDGFAVYIPTADDIVANENSLGNGADIPVTLIDNNSDSSIYSLYNDTPTYYVELLETPPDTSGTVTYDMSLEVEFTHSSGSSNVQPGDTATLGTYTLTALGGDVWIHDMELTPLAKDEINGDPFVVGADVLVTAQGHMNNCVLKDSSTGIVVDGPVDITGLNLHQMLFIDHFMVSEASPLELDVECEFTDLVPSGDSDGFAVYLPTSTGIVAKASSMSTGADVPVTVLSDNGNPPNYYLELVP